MRHLFGVTRFDAICSEMPPHETIDFSRTLLATMQVRVELSGRPADTIPATGPLIVVANHPFGLIEGMAIDALLIERRPDVTVMAWHLISEISEYRDRWIFVDPLRQSGKRQLNVQSWRKAFQWLARGGAFALFPAGRVARFRWSRMAVADRPWTPHVGALARRTRAPVLPVHFHGRNSRLFQIVGALLPTLEGVLLLHEVNNKRGQTLRAVIGDLIEPDELAAFASDEEATEFLRQRTDALARPMPTSPQIIRRRTKFDFDSAKARGWLAYRQDIEDFLNTVSFIFPTGEKFFIRSVQHYQDAIVNPALREQVKGFIYQEAMHSNEHTRCNDTLARTFVNGHRIERLVTSVLSKVQRFAPHRTQLAVTCALEHFTAILSDGLLQWQDTFISEGETAFAAMWLWHAVEETEHKAVCFDVYQEVSGKGVLSYLHRTTVMMATTLVFLVVLFASVRWLRRGQNGKADLARATSGAPRSPRPQAGRRNLWRLLKVMVSLRLYFDYYRPSFHPWNEDNTHLIDAWKQRHRDFGADLIPSKAQA